MPKTEVLSQTLDRIIEAHHDAFLLEVLGPGRAGLSVERVQELVEEGFITNKQMRRFAIPGMTTSMDPFSFMYAVSKVFDETPAGEHAAMRGWSLDEWKSEIDKRVSGWMVQGDLPLGGSVRVDLPKPPVPEVPKPPGETPQISGPPSWMSDAEQASYDIATKRAGEYIRGLGTLGSDDAEDALEEWDGEEIVTEVDAESRAETRKIVQEAVGEALEHRDPQRLASDLAEKTGNWTHNWDRIAKTELQAAYNDGRVLNALERYGDRTQVARFPESGACEKCIEHFTTGGRPIVWPIAELLDNGSNVGRKRSSWLATLYPMHTNCRCDTIIVPPGYQVRADGGLEREEQ